MLSIALALYRRVFLMVVCASIAGCSELAASGDSGAPKSAANIVSPEPFECDLGVLPENVQPADRFATYAGSAPAVSTPGDQFAFDGDRLYALTRNHQLSVIDSTDLDHLTLLSRYRVPYNALRLYPNGDTLWVLSGARGYDDPLQPNLGEVRVTAFDVADPAAIRELGSTVVPGAFDEAQRAGNVLYIVSNEYPACRDCILPAPPTVVTAIALDEPSATRPRSQLRLGEQVDQWTHSNVMLLTEQRMYVAGPQSGDTGPIGSTIHVVDITAADGSLRAISEVKVAGSVTSGWQLDEREDVLRVASVDGAAGSNPLVVETFAKRASDQFEPMGRLALPLDPSREKPDNLAGRFDAMHAYLAAESGDVLLTVDLSDPSAPKQVGRVQVGGKLRHVDVRDSRLFALTLRDVSQLARPLGVALVDIADPAAPILRSEVDIPNASTLGNVSFPEQPLEISADGKLLVVPYAAHDFGPRRDCSGRTAGGAQLISIDGDALHARGMAGSAGEPERAVLRDEHIVALGDQYIESYVFADLDAPQLRSRLRAQHRVLFVAQLAGTLLARVTQPDDNLEPQLEIVGVEQAADPGSSLGGLSLLDALTTDPEVRCHTQLTALAVSAQNATVYVAYELYLNASTGNAERHLGVLAIDASTPMAPRVAGKVDWVPVPGEWSGFDTYIRANHLSQPTYVWSGSTLLTLERNEAEEKRLRVVDLSDPEAPNVALLPLLNGHYVQLWATGDYVVASRYEQQDGARVRFFVDRIDISDPRAPRVLSTVNTPGALLSLDPETQRAISYCWHYVPLDIADACPETKTNEQSCIELHETIQLVDLTERAAQQVDASELPVDIRLDAVAQDASTHFLAASGRSKAALIAIPSSAESIEREQDQLDLTPARLEGRLDVSAHSGHIMVSDPYVAAWVSYEDGALELGEWFRPYSYFIEQLDVSERGAALANGQEGAQWLPVPE
jgi:hypothetical protein